MKLPRACLWRLRWHEVLRRSGALRGGGGECDSCFVTCWKKTSWCCALQKSASRDHRRLKLKLGEGITGWVAETSRAGRRAAERHERSRFKFFNDLPEDPFRGVLSVPLMSRGRLVGVINMQNRKPHQYSKREISIDLHGGHAGGRGDRNGAAAG